MKINNQYEEAEAIYPVTGLYIDPDGNAVEKSEMLLSEHRMDVYINDVLTMKLVCTPKDLPGLVLGRMVSEGMIYSSEEVEYLYICEHGTRARVQLVSEHCGLVNDNLSAEVMPVPRDLSSSCGTCVRFHTEADFPEKTEEVEQIVRVEPQGYVGIYHADEE